MLYNRIRIMAFDRRHAFNRFDLVARERMTDLLKDFGARYAGWQAHSYGMANPTHLLFIDEPTDEQIAQVLLFSHISEEKHGVKYIFIREMKGMESREYSVDNIMRSIANILLPQVIEDKIAACAAARTWSDLRVIQEMANLKSK